MQLIYILIIGPFLNSPLNLFSITFLLIFLYVQAVHTLVADPTEDLDSWLELVTLCRKENMFSLCENLLKQLGATFPTKISSTSLHCYSRDSQLVLAQMNPSGNSTGMISSSTSMPNLQAALSTSSTPMGLSINTIVQNKVNPRVVLATHKYWWCSGEKVKALNGLTDYISSLEPHSSFLTSIAEKSMKEIHGSSIKIDPSNPSSSFSGKIMTYENKVIIMSFYIMLGMLVMLYYIFFFQVTHIFVAFFALYLYFFILR